MPILNSAFTVFTPLVILLTASIIDIQQRRIPNWLTFPLIGFGFGYNYFHGDIHLSFIFAVILTAIGFVPNLLKWDWWGGGDVKLLAGVGAVYAESSMFILLLTFVGTAVWILWKNLTEGELGEEVYLPFAPFVLIGTIGYLVFIFI